MEQGDILTFGAYMTDDRTHELRFDPDKEGVPDRCWTISNLQHGSVITCEIQAKHNQVKIRKHSVSLNGQVIINITPDTEEKVRLFGTILIEGAKAYQAAH